MLAPGTDRWQADITLPTEGDWSFRVEGWSDPIGTWRHDAQIKIPLEQDVELVCEEGARLHERAADRRTEVGQAPASPRPCRRCATPRGHRSTGSPRSSTPTWWR